MKVLITGATGAIGRAVVKEFVKQNIHEIYTCSQNKVIWDYGSITHFKVNLLLNNEIEKLIYTLRPNCIIHLAWCSFGSGTNDIPQHIKWLKSGITLAEKFADVGGKRFIGCGTLQEYSSGNYERIEYISPTEPNQLYGSCKLSLYHAIKSIAKIGGFSFLWPRLPYVIGNGLSPKGVLGEAVTAILQKRMFCTRVSDRSEFDVIDTEDLGKLFCLFADNGENGIVNFSSGRTVKIKSFIQKMFTDSNSQQFFLDEAEGESINPQFLKLNNTKLLSIIGNNYPFSMVERKINSYLKKDTFFSKITE